MTLESILLIASRFVHIASAIAIVGGAIYARCIQGGMTDAAAVKFRKLALWTIAALVVSGIYNFLQKASVPSPYHALFGIKILLALHVFAVAPILAKAGMPEPKRLRMLTGIVFSGLAIGLLGAVLRWLSS
jgi:hypothetical protein